MKPNLILLTNLFPARSLIAETWLLDELKLTHNYYNTVYIVPDRYDKDNIELGPNCEVKNIRKNKSSKLDFSELFNCFKIVLSDYPSYPDKLSYFKSFRYNLSLIKQLHTKAKLIAKNKEWFTSGTIVYAYWADNLATTAAILIQKYEPDLKLVTRGHGFEIFEEQTLNNVIPFRKFQYRYFHKIYADSKKGYEHLNSKKEFEMYKNKNSVAYVGTNDYGTGMFNPNEFNIATCSVVRNVKRLHLLPEILKFIKFDLTWHVLGNGPDLENLKKLNSELPSNIKIIYHGQMQNSEILQFYKKNSINLLVSLSSSEGLPVSMMEAQSFGIPIMSTDVGGCNEICNENTGFLIDKNFNPEEVAKEILNFKNSDKNTKQFRDNCRNYWKINFNAEVNYKKFAEEIVNL